MKRSFWLMIMEKPLVSIIKWTSKCHHQLCQLVGMTTIRIGFSQSQNSQKYNDKDQLPSCSRKQFRNRTKRKINIVSGKQKVHYWEKGKRTTLLIAPLGVQVIIASWDPLVVPVNRILVCSPSMLKRQGNCKGLYKRYVNKL